MGVGGGGKGRKDQVRRQGGGMPGETDEAEARQGGGMLGDTEEVGKSGPLRRWARPMRWQHVRRGRYVEAYRARQHVGRGRDTEVEMAKRRVLC